MIERIPSASVSRSTAPTHRRRSARTPPLRHDGRDEVDFVAYAEDCLLFGRTILGGGRLSDMLNDHDEYVLPG